MQGNVMFMDEANEEVWTRYNQYDITPVVLQEDESLLPWHSGLKQ